MGFSTYIVILNESAPTDYEFEVDLPSGYKLSEDGSGGIEILNDEDEVVGTIAAPWAVDSNGDSVPTEFKLRGDTLVQTVEHSGAAYPVVADPSLTLGAYIYLWWDVPEDVDNVAFAAGVFQGLAGVFSCTFHSNGKKAGLACGLFYVYWAAAGVTAVQNAIDELPDDPPDDCQMVLKFSYLYGLLGRVEHSSCGTNVSIRVIETLSPTEIWEALFG